MILDIQTRKLPLGYDEINDQMTYATVLFVVDFTMRDLGQFRPWTEKERFDRVKFEPQRLLVPRGLKRRYGGRQGRR